MNRTTKSTVFTLSFIIALPIVFAGMPAAYADDVAVSRRLTTFYRAARKVISDNQALINDASKGDKGLSAETVVARAKENFQAATGAAFVASDDVDRAMLEAVAETMDEAQVLINEQGVGFKGFLPAVFARQVGTKFGQRMGGKMSIKLTAPKKYLRNRANRPDAWELNIIETKFSASGYEKGKPFSEMSSVKGKQVFRYILPEYYGESCLSCHGHPKGEVDITGGKKEGGVLGELGGAISLVIYQ